MRRGMCLVMGGWLLLRGRCVDRVEIGLGGGDICSPLGYGVGLKVSTSVSHLLTPWAAATPFLEDDFLFFSFPI